MVNTENTEGEIESTEREIVDEIETETKAETEIEAEAEDKSKGKTLGQKNYYIFKPFSYITDRVQADKNGLVVTEE
jgi:hypothetical protein